MNDLEHIIVIVLLSLFVNVSVALVVYNKVMNRIKATCAPKTGSLTLDTNKLKTLTERLDRADDEARRYKKEVDSILDNSPFILTRFDVETGRILYTSSAMEREFGVYAADCVGRTLNEIGIPEDIAELWGGSASIVARRKRVLEVECEHTRNQSDIKVYNTKFIPEGDTDVDSVLAITTDVTQRSRLISRLDAECKIRRFFLDYINVIMLALDTKGSIVMMNRFACNLLGVSEEEMLGKNWFDTFVPSDERSAVHDHFLDIKTDMPKEIIFENNVITAHGKTIPIRWTSTAITENNIVILISSIGREI